MPRFLFQVQPGRRPGFPVIEDDLGGTDEVRKMALAMFADLVKDIVAGLTEESEWRLDAMDESGNPIFRVRLIAESLGLA
jgi:hypothetical protein